MSIFVTVKVNEDTVADLRIGSMHWPQELDDVKEYMVTNLQDSEFKDAIVFNHRFGDGLAVLLQEAMTAIVDSKKIPNDGQTW